MNITNQLLKILVRYRFFLVSMKVKTTINSLDITVTTKIFKGHYM